MENKGKIEKLAEILREAKEGSVVFFGGAGVSTESGIPDFRSVDGLYHTQFDYPPETVLSNRFFVRHTDAFYAFYRQKMLCPNARPNDAHKVLAALENEGKLSAVVTQNIDGLHTAAGSKAVYELHGSTLRNRCTACGAFYGAEKILLSKGIPTCSCGGIIKPDVVLYEEQLDDATVTGAVRAIAGAETLIVAGTSLTVYPAAGLIDCFCGKNLVVINMSPTGRDEEATLLIQGRVGVTLKAAYDLSKIP